MHPAGRICKLSPMTVLTSASHVSDAAHRASEKKIFRPRIRQVASRRTGRIMRIALQLGLIRSPTFMLENDFNRLSGTKLRRATSKTC